MRAFGNASVTDLVRGVSALAAVLSLVVALIAGGMSHSPSNVMVGDAHVLHGHSHGDAGDLPLTGQDMADHEHQVMALPGGPDNPQVTAEGADGFDGAEAGSGAVRDGPIRPPRRV